MASKLLITGATGYIGGKLAESYAQSGTQIRLLVRNPDKLSARLRDSCEVVVGDLTSPETLTPVISEIDNVINAAGLLGHWGLSYQQLYESNVQGVENLIRAVFKAGVARFIHLSAGGVTGPVGRDAADETYPPAPFTDYERTKWEGEKRALEISTSNNWNLLVVRPTFTYGPGDPHKLGLFEAVKKGSFAFIGTGLSTVHPVYIDDLVKGIDLALRSNQRNTSIIIGGERPVTKQELIWGIADALGVKRPKIRLPVWIGNVLARGCELSARILNVEPPLTRSRVMMLNRNWGYSIARARELLGYCPRVELSEGLAKTVAWYREHGWL